MARTFARAVAALRCADWLTPRVVLLIAFAASVLSVDLLTRDIIFHTASGLTDRSGGPVGTDFINYWSSAHLATEGRSALAYDLQQFHGIEEALIGQGITLRIYTYPPVAMLLTWPLAALPFIPALIVWLSLGAAICASLLSRIAGWPMAVTAVLGAPAAMMNIHAGQNGFFVAAALAGGFMLLDRRPVLSGVVFGLLCCKPQMALLLPLALLAGGHWRTIGAATATVATMAGVSLLAFGADVWTAFFRQAGLLHQLVDDYSNWWRFMPTVYAAMRTFGAVAVAANWAQGASALAAAAIVIVVWRGRHSTEIKAATLVVGTFLVTPYAWDYDMVVTVFAAGWLAREGMRSGFLPWEKLTIAALLAFPPVMSLTATFLPLHIGPEVLWATLAVLRHRSLAFPPPVTAAVALIPGHPAARVAR